METLDLWIIDKGGQPTNMFSGHAISERNINIRHKSALSVTDASCSEPPADITFVVHASDELFIRRWDLLRRRYEAQEKNGVKVF